MSKSAFNSLQVRLVAGLPAARRILAMAALMASAVPASVACAQLRSGRTQRELPSETVRPAGGSRPAPAVHSSSSNAKMAVTTAVHNNDEYCPDCASGNQVSHFGGAIVSEGGAYSGMSYDSSGCDGLHCSSFGCGGCGSLGCSSCSDYSDIAPTCAATACAPACGPLMALWCRTAVRAEVPLFWRRAQGPPALVTTSPSGTSADLAGELGRATTSTLLGNSILSDTATAGVRLTMSTWLGCEDRYGLMFRYWNAGKQDDTFNFSSDTFPIIARPFLDTTQANAPVQNTQLISFPGDSIGNISVNATSKVDGLELSLKRLLYQDRFTRVDWLYGYQRVSIDESLRIQSNTTVTGNVPGLQGASIAVSDNFRAQNDFNGLAYGLMGSREVACWKMESLIRLGLGNLRRKVDIAGSTTTTSDGNSVTSSQGLLARNTNNTPFVDDTFVVIPEVGFNLACQIRSGLDFNIGYNYMLIPKVGQASQQINNNLAVNLSDPLTGGLDPALNFRERKYWINSLGLGLQLRY